RDCAPRSLHSLPTRRSSDLVWLTSTDIENNKLNRLRGWPIRGVKLEAEVIQRACREATFKALLETACHLLSEQGFELVIKGVDRSEEHTSELQSRENLVCRL